MPASLSTAITRKDAEGQRLVSEQFYKAFEDKFRGSEDEIKTRLSVYSPILMRVRSLVRPPQALDLGCGRGEWLDVLAQHRFKAAGVDTDAGMLKPARDKGHEVYAEDALEYLKRQKSDSLAIVSAFHVVEHLPFDTLQAMTSEAYRVLKPGGVLIYETPNPENLYVSTVTFHMDPTHRRPLPTELLAFVAENSGFDRTTPIFLNAKEDIEDKAAMTTADIFLNAPRDYAVVAEKHTEYGAYPLEADDLQVGIALRTPEIIRRADRRLSNTESTTFDNKERLAEQTKVVEEQKREIERLKTGLEELQQAVRSGEANIGEAGARQSPAPSAELAHAAEGLKHEIHGLKEEIHSLKHEAFGLKHEIHATRSRQGLLAHARQSLTPAPRAFARRIVLGLARRLHDFVDRRPKLRGLAVRTLGRSHRLKRFFRRVAQGEAAAPTSGVRSASGGRAGHDMHEDARASLDAFNAPQNRRHG